MAGLSEELLRNTGNGERNVFASLSQIIGIAEQANIVMKVMLENTSNERVLTENMHKIHALENNSDEAAFKLSQEITAGAVSPNIIDNLIQCVHLADDIVDNKLVSVKPFLKVAAGWVIAPLLSFTIGFLLIG